MQLWPLLHCAWVVQAGFASAAERQTFCEQTGMRASMSSHWADVSQV
jgi:hypothetical protein